MPSESSPKPIHFSLHAEEQIVLRGAATNEVEETIRESQWELAKRDRQQARRRFVFDKPSPITQKIYRFKTVDVIFVDEPNQIVVVTVKVYYSDEEVPQ